MTRLGVELSQYREAVCSLTVLLNSPTRFPNRASRAIVNRDECIASKLEHQ
jgi:hypothetical protein